MKETIRNIIRKDYDTIQDEDTVKDAISIFSKKSHPRTLLVFDKNNKYIGIITQRHIFRSGYSNTDIKIKKLVVKAPKISKDTSLFEIARLMLESNMKHLPVFDDDSILGRIRAIDLLKASLKLTNIGDLPIRRFMTASPIVIDSDAKINSVIHLFNEHAISRVPVIEDDKPIGVVSMHDVVVKITMQNNTLNIGDFKGEKFPETEANVKSIMNYPVQSLNPGAPVKDAINMMDELDLNSIMLVDEEGKLNGIITKKDLLEPLSTISEDKQKERKFVQLRGDVADLDNYDKVSVVKIFNDLLAKYDSHINEAHAFIDINPHKGKFNKGKMRGVNMYYIRARIISDIGTFIASCEQYGLTQSVNEAIRMLDKQINTYLEKNRQKEKLKSDLDHFELKATI